MGTNSYVRGVAKVFRRLMQQPLLAALLAFAMLSLRPLPAHSDAPVLSDEDRKKAAAFYQDKTISWVTYTSPGDGTDAMLRVFTKYLPRHIPGNPRMGEINYMRGGGGTISANFLNTRAPRDGTVIGQVLAGIARLQAFGHSAVRYDVREFNFIANYLPQNHWIFVTRSGIGLDTIEELMKAPQVNVGVQEVGHRFYDEMRLGAYFLGLRLNIIPGYSTSEQDLAMDRGEIEGRVHAARTFLTQFGQDYKAGKFKVHWSSEPARFELMPDVATRFQVFQKHANPPISEFEKRFLRFIQISTQWQRPFTMPPGVPRERVLAVREGVYKTVHDPQFRAEFEKVTGWPVEYTGGDVLNESFTEMLGMPGDVLKLYRVLNGPGPLPQRK